MADNDPVKTLLNFFQSPFADQVQANSIWVALGYSLGILAGVTLLFSLIRPHHVVVFAPKSKYADKKHTPPVLARGYFSWIKPVALVKEDLLIEKVGLDAAIFMRFIRMLRNMFIVLTILGCAILIPVHVTQTQQVVAVGNNVNINSNSTIILALTPQGTSANAMWAHVVVAYLFNFVVIGFIWWNSKAVVRIRRNFFQSPDYQKSLHSRSILLYDIPTPQRTDEGILRIVDSVEHTTGLPRPTIGRNVKLLPDLLEHHTAAVKQLESVLAKYLRDPNKLPPKRPTMSPMRHDYRADHGGKVDAIEYLTRHIQELEVEIRDERQSIDKRNAMGYGFATYDRIDEAHTVAYAARNKHPMGTTIRLAPKPNDFIWPNLALSKKTRSSKRFMANVWVALLTLIWVAPNALIAIFLVNLSHLGALWPAFQTTINGNPKFWGAVQAILGPTLLSTFYLCLPIIFRRLSTRSGDLTKTSREKHVTHKLYAFFVFNNLFVFSVFGAISGFVLAVISARNAGEDAWTAIQQANFARTLMMSLCTVSAFWLTWLLQRNLGAAIDIAQLWQLTCVWFARTFMSPTPRQNIEWTAPQPFDYASYFNYFLFYTTVALCNATLQPLVLPCVLVIFAIEGLMKKYLLLYVYVTKTESDGQFWNILVNRILFGLFIAHLVEALVIKGAQQDVPWTTYTQLICLIPLFLIIGGFKWYCVRNFDPRCKYYIKAIPNSSSNNLEPGLADLDAGKKRRSERVAVKFGHPALHKALIAPMVDSKAQHVLPTIYHGRIDQGDASGDIPMGPLGEGAKTGAPSMFEMVPEANQDFAYFKQRADFGEDHGGAGELFGRAPDMMSERSGTPASFLTQDSDDGWSAAPTLPPGIAGVPPLPSAGPHNPVPLRSPSGMIGSPRGRIPSMPNTPGTPGTPGHDGPYFYGAGGAAHARSGSEHSLLLARAAPPSNSPVPGIPAPAALDDRPASYREIYGLDRWRTGGSGYVGVAANDEDHGYDAYRERGGGSQPGSGRNTPSQYRAYNGGGGRSASGKR